MLLPTFDPDEPYCVVTYLRMSSDLQNKRSPDQQLAEIKKRLKALDLPWKIVKSYRDDAKSGKFFRTRPAYLQMMREIKSGSVAADLILVDTIERFGRVDELPTIRKQLYERHGVLVLTGDSNFADPTSTAGRALGMVESMRATEDGRVKSHNVLRGKRDAAKHKHWPGGPAPFGFKLKTVLKMVKGRREIDYSVLVPDRKTKWIMKWLFEEAARTGSGANRLSKALNAHPRIPDKFKPFYPGTVGIQLDNPIYYGELLWEKNATGVVDDMRVLQPHAAEDMLRVPDFCKPIVSRKVWDKAQSVRRARRDRNRANLLRKAEASGKLILPPAPGLSVNYLLSGLVFCAECGLRMTASSTKAYTTKAGATNRYTAYVCPGYLAGHCGNDKRVPEAWLREVVVGTIRNRLFPLD